MSQGIAKKAPNDLREACERRREEILDAASRLFAEHGYSDAVTQLLADDLKVGKGTIYRHFPSKRDLFLAAADRVMWRLTEQVEASRQTATDPLDGVRRAVKAFLDFFAAHPEYAELIVQERALFKDRDKPTFLAYRERNVERWRGFYRSLIAEGRLRPMPAEQISDVMTALIYGAMFLNYSSGCSGAFSARAEDIIDVVLFGILSDSERQRLGLGDHQDQEPTAATNGHVAEPASDEVNR
jgi:AcrR family transcriptional regulator